ncbi:MAG: ATP-binding protein [Proteobacteria bacterium]|nr:ATP-binding protein [Pseudomonadota bacterium]
MPASKSDNMTSPNPELAPLLGRIADALDRLSPLPASPIDLDGADAFVWHADEANLEPITKVSRIDLHLLQGIESQCNTLSENTRRFADGLPANNALLWGARGMGKSSLVKAIHGAIVEAAPGRLKLVEIHREDIPSLPRLLKLLRHGSHRFVLFCDDLSFDNDDASYKSLKAVLEGGIEGRPSNVIFYATSNRRHLMPRDMMENERSTAISPSEAVEEKVSLSDRFGLWLGFHNCSQEEFIAMLDGYCRHYGLAIGPEELRAEAIEWSVTRGARNGRVAWQFIQDLAGRMGVNID